MNWKPYARALSHKINLVLGTRCRGVAPMTFVFGYPKSGTTWGCQLIADCIEKPFPRYNLFPTACPAVIHGHETISPKLIDAAYIVRDGRDAIVSLYVQLALQIPPSGKAPRSISKYFPPVVDSKDYATNFPRFIKEVSLNPFAAPINWSEHVARSIREAAPNQPVIKYEDLLSENAAQVLADAVAQLTGKEPDLNRAKESLDRYAFKKQVNKPTVESPTFMNKGKAGNWRNYFTREAAQVFADTMGQGLIAAGYEPDNSWVQSVPETLPAPSEAEPS